MWIVVCAVIFVGYLSVPRRYVRHRRRSRRVRQPVVRQDLDMGAIVTEVATRLRSGASAEQAWAGALDHAGLRTQIPMPGRWLANPVQRWRGRGGRGGRALRGGNSASSNASEYGRNRSGVKNRAKLAAPQATAGMGGAESILDENGVPLVLYDLMRRPWGLPWKHRVSQTVRHSLPAVFAVCHMSTRTGAPMAEVLDSCAAGITESGEAQAAREVALAGPRSSARMLAFLPVLGLFLGWLLGADPVGFLCGTAIGRIALLAGVAFESAGIMWTTRLVARARSQADR
ncbi:type II secretion system F family protein [Trueperella sp. LYQ141]|uniref:type II secretion system F family protein n=1 Tax=Trueperella sp. LYQ141 TaxID=3391058 RepID=UPI0039839E3E